MTNQDLLKELSNKLEKNEFWTTCGTYGKELAHLNKPMLNDAGEKLYKSIVSFAQAMDLDFKKIYVNIKANRSSRQQ